MSVSEKQGTERADTATGEAAAGGPMLPVEQEVARGLRFTHMLISAVDDDTRKAAASRRSAPPHLGVRGIIGETDLNPRDLSSIPPAATS